MRRRYGVMVALAFSCGVLNGQEINKEVDADTMVDEALEEQSTVTTSTESSADSDVSHPEPDDSWWFLSPSGIHKSVIHLNWNYLIVKASFGLGLKCLLV